ncbi:CPA1 family monovalent cation:H+ antiporter [Sphingomonas jinjuensis]|uniref:CPA1 family monovalent cation:H+ antiporter n=1 Tax=Sphingomonas jinjuensis TaxID=535907 RepID=A0A840F7U9_9SPHN|nr:Na+/H+ antiporter [Sphingomonas jinjuensis]MBB4155323.1 CPA1 family monovalent cation:H+ antiporter [Sphingomonas jinjuensis]
MHVFELILVMLSAALALTVAARWLQVPAAVLLVLGGMVLAFVPALPHLRLDPELALALFLPPLLQASALRTDWNLFKSNIVFIVSLAFGAVLFTAGAVAFAARELIPGLGWPAAIVLGAIVAPPDAVAATSVLKRFRLPKRIVAVLEGESLVNDASALVLYKLGISAALLGSIGTGEVVGSFALTALVGVLVGLAAGKAANWLMLRLKDRFLEIMVSFLAGFVSYLVAEWIEGSGVLAAVACGGLIGRAQLRLAARTRLQAVSAWELVEFILASMVFLLVGLQLREIVDRLTEYSLTELLLLGGATSAVLIVARIVWVFVTFYPASALVAVIRGEPFSPPLSYPTIISWAGMRGVVSLAAALALPTNFQGRDLIVFLAFCAIFSTLVIQGTTLKWLIGWFDLRDPDIGEVNEATIAAREIVAAAIAGQGIDTQGATTTDEVLRLFRERKAAATRAATGTDIDRTRLEAMLRRKLEGIQSARLQLKERRDQLDGETLATLTRELDLEEEQILLAIGDTGEAEAL